MVFLIHPPEGEITFETNGKYSSANEDFEIVVDGQTINLDFSASPSTLPKASLISNSTRTVMPKDLVEVSFDTVGNNGGLFQWGSRPLYRLVLASFANPEG